MADRLDGGATRRKATRAGDFEHWAAFIKSFPAADRDDRKDRGSCVRARHRQRALRRCAPQLRRPRRTRPPRNQIDRLAPPCINWSARRCTTTCRGSSNRRSGSGGQAWMQLYRIGGRVGTAYHRCRDLDERVAHCSGTPSPPSGRGSRRRSVLRTAARTTALEEVGQSITERRYRRLSGRAGLVEALADFALGSD